MTDRDELLRRITEHYLAGRDFNGYPLRNVELDRDQLDALLTDLVREGLISLNFATYHPNPYVKAFPPEPVDDQLDRLSRLDDLTHLTAYPEGKYLEKVVDRENYEGRPYALRLALGAPELMPVFFDLSVLEVYRNDPRYYYEADEISGRISVTDEFYESEHMKESDRILLQTFGFGYNNELQRAVCTFPRYLAFLSPEHQQIWAARELGGGYSMHPAYAANVSGHWADKVSVFTAFTEELDQLQKMSEAAGLPSIVRRNFKGSDKPTNFSFLLRPTVKELQDFHGTLDKMLSENLNQAFFESADINPEREITRKDGKIEVQRKGTIALLEEWTARIRFPDPGPKNEMLRVFREVRKLRQRPAHAADDNRFDQQLFREQHDLVVRAYGAIRTLRQILANHPELKGYSGVPDWLYKGEIYTY